MSIKLTQPAHNIIRIAVLANVKPHQLDNLARQLEAVLNTASDHKHIMIDAAQSQVSPNYIVTLLVQSGLIYHPRLGCIAVIGAGMLARLFGRLSSPNQVRYLRSDESALRWFEGCVPET